MNILIVDYVQRPAHSPDKLAKRLRDSGHTVKKISNDRFNQSTDDLDLILIRAIQSEKNIESVIVNAICRDIKDMRIKRMLTPMFILFKPRFPQQRIDILQAGADAIGNEADSPELVEAKVNAIVRRASGLYAQVIKCGKLTLDLNSESIFIDNEEITFTGRQYQAMRLLLQNCGRILSRQEIIDEIYGEGKPIEKRTIDVLIGHVRKKLKPYYENGDTPIKTRGGFGYGII